MDKVSEFRGKYFFLSNFYKCDILYDGFWFPTSEHAYQASKTNDCNSRILFASQDQIEKYTSKIDIREISLKEVKSRGRSLVIRDNFDSMKLNIMLQIVLFKFTYYPQLTAMLKGTNPLYLEEGNWWGDTFWGVYNGNGENNLGKILMNVRSLV